MHKKFAMLTATLGILFTLSFTSCKKDNDNNNSNNANMMTVTGNATGAQEVPAVTTTATGTITGSYNMSTNLLSYTITWQGLSGAPTGMHFHGPAMAGQSAGVASAIAGFPTTASGNVSGTVTLTDAQEADIMAGKWYYNIHTAANGTGEIRGQITLQ